MKAGVSQPLNVTKHWVTGQVRSHALYEPIVDLLYLVITHHRVFSFFQMLPDLVETVGLHLTLKQLISFEALFDLVSGPGRNHMARFSPWP